MQLTITLHQIRTFGKNRRVLMTVCGCQLNDDVPFSSNLHRFGLDISIQFKQFITNNKSKLNTVSDLNDFIVCHIVILSLVISFFFYKKYMYMYKVHAYYILK